MAQKISQMTEQTTASMTEAGTSDFLGGYTATGGNANRKFSLSGLANYFLNKFKMTLGGSSQTVKSAIDALNSNLKSLKLYSFDILPNSSITLHAGRENISFLVLCCSSAGDLANIAEIWSGYATATRVRRTSLTNSANTGLTYDFSNDTTIDVVVTNTNSFAHAYLHIVRFSGGDITAT